MGVWIEIISDVSSPLCGLVTPFMGVWIEILFLTHLTHKRHVTPFMGVWIEISATAFPVLRLQCHSLHGSVD